MTKDQQPSQGDVERVARAIFAAGFSADEDRGLIDKCWNDWSEERERALRKARAAIAALHSTSEGRVEQMRDAVIAAYRAGAEAVHNHWAEHDPEVEAHGRQGGPDFTEAAHDYADAALGGSNE